MEPSGRHINIAFLFTVLAPLGGLSTDCLVPEMHRSIAGNAIYSIRAFQLGQQISNNLQRDGD